MAENISGSFGGDAFDKLLSKLEAMSDQTKAAEEVTDEIIKNFNKLNKNSMAKYYKSIDQQLKDINDLNKKRIAMLKEISREQRNELQLKDLRKVENALRITTKAYADYVEVVYSGKKKLSSSFIKLYEDVWSNKNDANGILQYAPDKTGFKDLFKVIKQMEDAGYDLSKYISGYTSAVQDAVKEVDWSKLIDSKEIAKDIKAAEKVIDKFYNRINEQKAKNKEPSLTNNMIDNASDSISRIYTYYNKAGVAINNDLQEKINTLLSLLPKYSYTGEDGIGEKQLRITNQYAGALFNIEKAQASLPKITQESSQQQIKANEEVVDSTRQVAQTVEEEAKALSLFDEKVAKLEDVISRSPEWIKNVDDTGLFVKLLVGKDGKIKTVENIVDDVYSVWSKAYNKFNNATKDVWSDDAFEKYKKDIEKIYPYIKLLNQSRITQYVFDLLSQKNKEYLSFGGAGNEYSDTIGLQLYKEWSDSIDLSKKSNSNTWKMANELETNYDLLSTISSTYETIHDLNELNKIGEEEYLAIVEREVELRRELVNLGEKYPRLSTKEIDQNSLAESDITIEKAKETALVLNEEADSIGKLISEVEWFNSIRKNFEGYQVEVFGSQFYHEKKSLEELQSILRWNAESYKNIETIRKRADYQKFEDATDFMMVRSTPKKIEEAWEKISNACYRGEIDSSKAIEDFKREVESLGYEFDKQSNKWQQLQPINPDVSASLSKLQKLKDALIDYRNAEEEVLMAEQDSPEEAAAERELERIDKMLDELIKKYYTLAIVMNDGSKEIISGEEDLSYEYLDELFNKKRQIAELHIFTGEEYDAAIEPLDMISDKFLMIQDKWKNTEGVSKWFGEFGDDGLLTFKGELEDIEGYLNAINSSKYKNVLMDLYVSDERDTYTIQEAFAGVTKWVDDVKAGVIECRIVTTTEITNMLSEWLKNVKQNDYEWSKAGELIGELFGSAMKQKFMEVTDSMTNEELKKWTASEMFNDIRREANGLKNNLFNPTISYNTESTGQLAMQIEGVTEAVWGLEEAENKVSDNTAGWINGQINWYNRLNDTLLSTDDAIASINKRIKDSEYIIGVQKQWESLTSIVDKDFSTNSKKEAIEQLRTWTNVLTNFRSQESKYRNSNTEDRINIGWYRSMQEALNKQVSNKWISTYQTDITKYDYDRSLQNFIEARNYAISTIEEQNVEIQNLLSDLEYYKNPPLSFYDSQAQSTLTLINTMTDEMQDMSKISVMSDEDMAKGLEEVNRVLAETATRVKDVNDNLRITLNASAKSSLNNWSHSDMGKVFEEEANAVLQRFIDAHPTDGLNESQKDYIRQRIIDYKNLVEEQYNDMISRRAANPGTSFTGGGGWTQKKIDKFYKNVDTMMNRQNEYEEKRRRFIDNTNKGLKERLSIEDQLAIYREGRWDRDDDKISTSDPLALKKHEAKLEFLEKEHAEMIAYNKEARKAGKEQIPSYRISYSNRAINEEKRTIEALKKLAEQGSEEIITAFTDGTKLIRDAVNNRIKFQLPYRLDKGTYKEAFKGWHSTKDGYIQRQWKTKDGSSYSSEHSAKKAIELLKLEEVQANNTADAEERLISTRNRAPKFNGYSFNKISDSQSNQNVNNFSEGLLSVINRVIEFSEIDFTSKPKLEMAELITESVKLNSALQAAFDTGELGAGHYAAYLSIIGDTVKKMQQNPNYVSPIDAQIEAQADAHRDNAAAIEDENKALISSGTTAPSPTQSDIKNWKEYNDLVAVGYDRQKKMEIISKSGTTGNNSVYDLLRLNHPVWDEVKANNFFNNIPEDGLERYTAILDVVERIVKEMVEASGLTEDQIVSQLKNIKSAQGGYFKANGNDSGWSHFATYSDSNNKDAMNKQNGITYKVYAAFDDIKDLNENIISSLMDELSKAGFKGRLKTTTGSTSFGDKLNGLAITDQLVVHGSSKKDQEIAYNIIKNVLGNKLSYLGGGIDTPDGSFSETLRNGTLGKYISQIQQESQAAQEAAQAEKELAKSRQEANDTQPNKNGVSSSTTTPSDYKGQLEAEITARQKIATSADAQYHSEAGILQIERQLVSSASEEQRILTSVEKQRIRQQEQYNALKQENNTYSREAVKFATQLLKINGLLTKNPNTNLRNINALASDYDGGNKQSMYSTMADIALSKRDISYLGEQAPVVFEILDSLRSIAQIRYSDDDVQQLGLAWEFLAKNVGKARLSLTSGTPLEQIINESFGEGLQRMIFEQSDNAVSGLSTLLNDGLYKLRSNLISQYRESGEGISLSDIYEIPKTIQTVNELEDAFRKAGVSIESLMTITKSVMSGGAKLGLEDIVHVLDKLNSEGISIPDNVWARVIESAETVANKFNEAKVAEEEVLNPRIDESSVVGNFEKLQNAVAAELTKGKKIISQSWLGNITLKRDEKGNAFLKGVYSYVEELRTGQRQVVKAVYNAAYDELSGTVDATADEWNKTVVNLKTAFKSVEDQVLKSDEKIARMENALSKNSAKYGSLPETERKIALEKEHRDTLMSELNYYSDATTYVQELDREEKLYAYDVNEFLDRRLEKQKEINAAISAENELESKKAAKAQGTKDTNRINAVNRTITGWENRISKIVNRYDSSVNPNADKVVPVGTDEYNRLQVVLGQILQRIRQIKDTAADPSIVDSIQKDINAFELLAKNAMDAFKVKTSDLTGSNLDTAITNKLNELDAFIAKCKMAGSAADEVRKKAEETRRILSENKDAVTYNKAKDALSNYRTELTKVIAEEKVQKKEKSENAIVVSKQAQKDAAKEEKNSLDLVRDAVQGVYDAYYALFKFLKTGKGNFSDLYEELQKAQVFKSETINNAYQAKGLSVDDINNAISAINYTNQEKYSNTLKDTYSSISDSIDKYIEKLSKSDTAISSDVAKLISLKNYLLDVKQAYDAGLPSIDNFVDSVIKSGNISINKDDLTKIFEGLNQMMSSKNFAGLKSVDAYLSLLAKSGKVADGEIEALRKSLYDFVNMSFSGSEGGLFSGLNQVVTLFGKMKSDIESRTADFKELDSVMKAMSKTSFTNNKTSDFINKLDIIKQKMIELKNNWVGSDEQKKKLQELTNEAIKLKQVANGFKQTTAKGTLINIDQGNITNLKELGAAVEKYVADLGGSNLVIKKTDEANKQLTFTFRDEAGNIIKAKASVDGLSNSMRVLNTTTKKYMTFGEAFSSELKMIASRLSYTFSFAGLIMKMTSAFREGISTLKEYDSALTTISYTMDLTKSELNNIGESAMKMAEDLSMSLDNAMSIYQIYANMNTTAEEIGATGTATAILSNLSGVDASTAADQVQGIIQQFSLLEDAEADVADTSMHVVDVLDKISSNVAVDYAKGISVITEAVTNTGQVAYDAGMSYEELAGVTAKIAERTREDGSTIGNALKTKRCLCI